MDRCGFNKKIEGSSLVDFLLRDLIVAICRSNLSDDKDIWIFNPYYNISEVLSNKLKIEKEENEDSFQDSSYTVEGIMHLLVRRNWKQHMKMLWSDISKLMFLSFETKNKWDFFRWRAKDGINKTLIPKPTQQWQELKELAFESEGNNIPNIIKKDPIFLLLFLNVFPHRCSSEIVRWLDSQLNKPLIV